MDDGTEKDEFKSDDKRVEKIETATVPVVATVESTHASNSAGMLILQWLTYAFWGWLLVALTFLIIFVLLSIFTDSDTSGPTPYAIAATIVLLPIALLCEILYGRKESIKKSGAATIIMVIHAVIFALFGIGALITSVFLIVQTTVGASRMDTSYQLTLAAGFLITAVLYAMTFFRTLNPIPKIKVQKIYPIAIGLIVVAFIIGGFIGPVSQARLVRVDNDASDAVKDISRKVNNYASTNKKLPESLASLSLDADTKSAIDTSSITLKQGGLALGDESFDTSGDNQLSVDSYRYKSNTAKRFNYQVCVDYNKKSSYYSDAYDDSSDAYDSSYANTSNHPAGNYCYKLKTTNVRD